MIRAVYIAGLEHTGSTVLELLLSCHPRVCGLGEVAMLTEPARAKERLASLDRRRCSCGLGLHECPLWRNYIRHLQEHGIDDTTTNYLRLIDTAERASGEQRIWCDSSKSAEGMRQWAEVWRRRGADRNELLVIHIAKDARNWVASEKRRYGDSALAVYRRFSLWEAANRSIAATAAQEELSCLALGYEELCFDTPASIERVCAALQLPAHAAMHDLRNSQAHVGAGNASRLKAHGSESLRYDYRWYFEWAVNFWYLMRPGIRSANLELVYSKLRQP